MFAFALVFVIWAFIFYLYANVFGDSFACPTEKRFYVCLTFDKDVGYGIFERPEFDALPRNVVYKGYGTILEAKKVARRLKRENPQKHYELVYHY